MSIAVAARDVESTVGSFTTDLRRLREEIGKVVVGQRYVVERLMIGLLSDGHVLLEGVPGLAKTTLDRKSVV